MGDSLRDQLLKTGLVNDQDVKRVQSEKSRQKRQSKQNKKGRRDTQSDEARRAADAAAAKRERDRALNREREAKRRKEADEHAARELVVKHEIKRSHDAEHAFNFTDGTRIKKINVDKEQLKGLVAGELAIARTRGHYRLIPREIAERVQPTAPFLIAHLDTGETDDDPAYEDHPVPDDLMW